MRPGHARDNCRHIEIHLLGVSVVPDDRWIIRRSINALGAATGRDHRERTEETSGEDPVTR